MSFKSFKKFLKDREIARKKYPVKYFFIDGYYSIRRAIIDIKHWHTYIYRFFERLIKGYDYSAYWNLGNYLAINILKHLKHFKKMNRMGYPVLDVDDNYTDKDGMGAVKDCASDKWEKTLDDMIEGFQYLVDSDDWLIKMQNKYKNKKNKNGELIYIEELNKKDKLMKDKAKLFTEHLLSLWD